MYKKILLLKYYLFLQYLPMQPFPGYRIFYKLRYFIVKRLLKSCGKDVIVKDRAYFGDGSKLSIGDRSQIGQNVRLLGEIIIGNDVIMGPDIIIMAVTHDTSNLNRTMINPINNPIEKPVLIGDDVWIGTRAIIQPGVTIGNHSIIGSGAVVTKSVDPYSVVAGVPARLIKFRK